MRPSSPCTFATLHSTNVRFSDFAYPYALAPPHYTDLAHFLVFMISTVFSATVSRSVSLASMIGHYTLARGAPSPLLGVQ